MNQNGLGLTAPEVVERVDEYQFEPIQGYPMLQWQGKRPFRSTRYYPAQLREVHGPEVEGWRNKIYWGDNLQVMSHLLKDYRGRIDLIYIDPPFDSKADYSRKISVKGKNASSERSAFEEKQYVDIWVADEYLQFLFERLILMRELLASHGSIFIHMGSQVSNYARCVADEVFGRENFRNEIMLPGRAVKNLQQQFETISRLPVRHDVLLWYAKSESVRLNVLWVEKHNSGNPEGHWHHFWSTADRPTMRYELFGITPTSGQWVWKEERALIAVDNYDRYLEEHGGRSLAEYWRDTGKSMEFIRRSPDDGKPQYWRAPAEDRIADTVWSGIPIYSSSFGYPTEKNRALLDQVVEFASQPDQIVADFFCGSGVTLESALSLGRRFIGADINLGAIHTSTKRLMALRENTKANSGPVRMDFADELLNIHGGLTPENSAGFELHTVNHYDIFRNAIQAKDLLLEALELEPLGPGHLFDGTRDGRMWKIMPVNRISTRADLNEIITGLDQRALQRRYDEHPNRPVESVTLVCMGHEPDLAASLKQELKPFEVDVEVVDILRDRQDLQFKRDSEAKIVVKNEELIIEAFYPMNLLQKLSQQKEDVTEWRELVESVMVDWNYDGAVLQPAVVDVPDKNEFVIGRYSIPEDAGTIRVKITDLLSESWEGTVQNG